uniref:Capsid protein n=1 Tax=Erysiphe necator associated polymycovirus 5 TaxID=2742559 RepID=A0A8E3YWG2_9VIRU|nr:capsid protein [Erysiphe necator associated polymycovirus 5]
MSGYLTVEDAKRISEVGEPIVRVVIKLAANGLTSERILALARAVAGGEPAPFDLAPGQPRTLKIQAYSCLHDPRQYADLYGMTEAVASELRIQFKVEPEVVCERITQIAVEALRRRGSPRGVVVTMDGTPGSPPTSPSPTTSSSDRLRAFKAEIASNSGVYGSYVFEARPTYRDLTRAFSVDLGWNCFVLAQSKALAIAVARIVRVKSRHDPSVRDFVHYIDPGNNALAGMDIPPTKPDLAVEPRGAVTPSTRDPVHMVLTTGGASPSRSSPTDKGSRGPQSVVAR